MYGYIKGRLTQLRNDYAILEAGGVGYRLFISLTTHSALSPFLDKEAKLHTHLNVKDDALTLYGFADDRELSLFRHLITVSGVGPKVAMSVLSSMTVESFTSALINNDPKSITRAPGVGLKTAQKIIIELKDKLAKEMGAAEIMPDHPEASTSLNAVVDTLTVYGFSRTQIIQAMSRVDTKLPVEVIIRETLKILGSG